MKNHLADRALAAAIAAHRFGLGEPKLDAIRSDPVGWLSAQIGPAEPARGTGMLSSAQAITIVHYESRVRVDAEKAAAGTADADHVRRLKAMREEVTANDVRSRMLSALHATRPFAERLAWFWANHFAVSIRRGFPRGTVGSFEREAIRPHIASRFEDMLFASTTHPAMLRYLDNVDSAGPNSAAVQRGQLKTGEVRPPKGLNENLAREVMELHTLGVGSGMPGATGRTLYTQADVTSLAKVLTGWRVGPYDHHSGLEASWHEPGTKTLLRRTYAEGEAGLRAVVADLARHPQTVRFLATKLARHFVADEPPPALVERLMAAYRAGDGRLDAVYRALLESPEAWAERATKLKTPEEFVVSSARLLQIGEREKDAVALADLLNTGAIELGQRPQGAPSPQGWLDRAEEWLGPDALWKRVEWATHLGRRFGRYLDARALSENSFGPLLGAGTRTQLSRAADGPQALALLLMSPEFQRR